jgi:RNA polymerase sigma-70 factor (ECF subfamily)
MDEDIAALEARTIARVLQGDMLAFRTLYEMHSRRVFSVCFRIVGDHALAEDLVQETFLTVFRRLGTFRGDSAFCTWLYRIAVNVVFMHLRRVDSRISEVYPDDWESETLQPRIEGFGRADPVLRTAEMRLALQRAISKLPHGYRLVFVLHDIYGYEHQEIAEMMGCSMGNTKSQLHKARAKLRRLLYAPVAQQEPVTETVYVRSLRKAA